VRTHKVVRRILVIDDDKVFCSAVADYFTNEATEVFTAHTGEDGLAICAQHGVDVVLLDQKLPDAEGVSLCSSILDHHDQTKIIFITAYPSFDNAVEAIKTGAYDYLSKPFELEELHLAIERAMRTVALERIEQLQSYKDDKESEETVLVSGNGAFAEIRQLIDVAASEDAPILITGETGTGKSIVARSIHYRGLGQKRVFMCINCAALPENLIEAELFGCEKGAFTGAVNARKGIFELAEGGTLLLDEIGAMPLHLQSKLLGVLEDKKIRRIGGESVRSVEVRVIAASNTDLEDAITKGTFREDLYYRLSVIRIHIPPLRDRKEDIPELCRYFIHKMTHGSPVKLSDSELARLMEYEWPGNVRELKNVLERSLILHKRSELRPSKFLNGGFKPSSTSSFPLPGGNGSSSLAEVERRHIRYVLNIYSGNYTQTARALGISLSTLKRKVKRYGLVSPDSQ
jgi:DNA-binding NtrC family response regulator